MVRRAFFPLLLVTALCTIATAPLAVGSTTDIRASAELGNLPAALGGGYYMNLTNNGTDPIPCWIFNLPDRKAPLGVTGGKLTADGQAVIGGPLAPGASVQVRFTTADPISPSASPAAIFLSPGPVSATGLCTFTANDARAAVTSLITAAPAPATGCTCSTLTGLITKATVSRTANPARALAVKVTMQFSMQCTGTGTGACSGTLAVHGTSAEMAKGLKVDDSVDFSAHPIAGASYNLRCTGRGMCAARYKGSATFTVAGTGALANGELGKTIKTLTLLAGRTCNGSKSPQTFKLAFAGTGQVDLAKSDLDG